MGVPKYVKTDNMKSVVIRRDCNGLPVWNLEYEMFMKAVGFHTKLCKSRNPFTKLKTYFIKKFELNDMFSMAQRFGKPHCCQIRV